MITILLAGFILSGVGLISILLGAGSVGVEKTPRKEVAGKTIRRSSFSSSGISSIQTTNW